MATRLQRRRNTTGALDLFVGAEAETVIDTTKRTYRVCDGETPGGAPASETVVLSSIKELGQLPPGFLRTDRQYSVVSFWDGWAALLDKPQGGGTHVWNPDRPKEDHNGGTVIDPDKLSEIGLPSDADPFGTYFTASASGSGCFEFIGDVSLATVHIWGAIGNNIADDTLPIQKAVDFCSATSQQRCRLGYGHFKVTQTITNGGSVILEGENLTWVNRSSTILRADNTTPFTMLMGFRSVIGVRFASEQYRLHDGLRTRAYNAYLKNIYASGMKAALRVSGVYVYFDHVFCESNDKGLVVHHLESNSAAPTTTVDHHMCKFISNDVGWEGADTTLDRDDNYEIKPVSGNADLIRVGFIGCGFEVNRIGMRSDARLWLCTLQDGWTENNTEAGLDLDNRGHSIVIQNMRQNPGDVWNLVKNREFGGQVRLDREGRLYAGELNRWFNGNVASQPIQGKLLFRGDTLAVEESVPWVSDIVAITSDRFEIQTSNLNKVSVDVSYIDSSITAVPIVRMRSTIDIGAINSFGIYNRIEIYFLDAADMTTRVKPSRVSVNFSIAPERAWD